MHIITQGDDVKRVVTLKHDASSVIISPTATVTAVVVADNTVFGPVTCSNADPEADWANGVVAVTFDKTLSSQIPLGKAKVEIQVDDSGEETWHITDIFVIEKHL